MVNIFRENGIKYLSYPHESSSWCRRCTQLSAWVTLHQRETGDGGQSDNEAGCHTLSGSRASEWCNRVVAGVGIGGVRVSIGVGVGVGIARHTTCRLSGLSTGANDRVCDRTHNSSRVASAGGPLAPVLVD